MPSIAAKDFVIEQEKAWKEHDHQVQLFEWIKGKAFTNQLYSYIFAIPNGGLRPSVTKYDKQGRSFRDSPVARKLRQEGVTAGIPDIFVAVPQGNFAGLWIEMKAMKGYPSDEQEEWLAKLNKIGYKALICRGYRVAQKVIETYLEGDSNSIESKGYYAL